MKKNVLVINKEKAEGTSKPRSSGLPDIDVLSDWLFNSHPDRIQKIYEQNGYDKYSVYERYDESKGLI